MRESQPPRESHIDFSDRARAVLAREWWPGVAPDAIETRAPVQRPPAGRARLRGVPPPPTPSGPRATLANELIDDFTRLASVRVDAYGTLIDASGDHDHLVQLVAYVTRLVSLIQSDFGLDPFEALHAELAGLRVLVLKEAGETFGLLMQPGSAAKALRQRLGV